jgi:parallel beta-helix repeat protein
MSISGDSARGFLSYVRADFYSINTVLKFRDMLQWSIGSSLGSDFDIYLDRSDLPVGEDHDPRLRDAITESFLFFAMVSLRYFRNPNTREELELALSTRTQKGDGNYFIVPIYTLQGPEEIYTDPDLQGDRLISALKTISMVDDDDFRKLYRRLGSSSAEQRMRSLGTRLASQIRSRPPPRSDPAGSGVEEAVRIEGKRHVVAKDGGDFSSIQDAINFAAPGDCVYVSKGVYREALLLNKPLELIGDGLGEVEVQASGDDVLRVQTAIGHITGFRFSQKGTKGFGVSIGQGKPELHGCEITSSGSACLAVHSAANPIVHNNDIHHGAQGGVFVFDKSLGIFEDNKIHHCKYANVEIAKESAPTFRRNEIYEGLGGGIFVHDHAQGLFENNKIHHNTLSNVNVSLKGSPHFRKNRISHAYGRGVNISDGGGEFEGNVICWNRGNGVVISNQGSPIFRQNELSDNTEAGAYFTGDALGQLEQNHISGNIKAGVAIDGRSAPEIWWNTITRNRAQGIYITNAGDPVVERNLVTRNNDAGITMIPVVSGIRGNRSKDNGTFGLSCIAGRDQADAFEAVAASNSLDDNFLGPKHLSAEETKEIKEVPVNEE